LAIWTIGNNWFWKRLESPLQSICLTFSRLIVVINILQTVDERKKKNMVRKQTAQYITARYRTKARKYQQKESKEYTYGLKKESKKKDGKKDIKKTKVDGEKTKEKSKPRSCICYGCDKIVSEYAI
jgi:signal transduction histidine kinase